MSMQLMIITKQPDIASFVESAGVGRIFIDMETLGKHERQAGFSMPINSHTFEEAAAVKRSLKSAELMIRINPVHHDTETEVERAIDAGADCIMLPFFKHPEEVETFISLVKGRVKTNLLFETGEAVGRADQIINIGGYDEIHFGLNDLRLSLKLDFLFESFAGGLIEWLCQLARKAGVSYGIGGIGRLGKELLPAELIVAEHVRLGSERVILSRVFHGDAATLEELRAHGDFGEEIRKLRAAETAAHGRSADQTAKDHLSFVSCVREIADTIRAKRAANP